MLCNTPSTVTPVSKRKESLFPPAYVVTSIDTPCSARSCGRERLSSERGALCATGVLDIRTSTELSITLRISTPSIGFNEVVATAFCSLLKFFSSIQNRQSKTCPESFDSAAMWMSSHEHTSALGISVSRIEPSGVFVSRFSQSSSRSLGRCLLLGQRSRMNLFSHLIRSLFHQDYRNPHTEFAPHRNDGYPGSHLAWMALANRAEKFSKLAIFSNRRPCGLNEL